MKKFPCEHNSTRLANEDKFKEICAKVIKNITSVTNKTTFLKKMMFCKVMNMSI